MAVEVVVEVVAIKTMIGRAILSKDLVLLLLTQLRKLHQAMAQTRMRSVSDFRPS